MSKFLTELNRHRKVITNHINRHLHLLTSGTNWQQQYSCCNAKHTICTKPPKNKTELQLCLFLNRGNRSRPYKMEIGAPVGRHSYREQFVFFYRYNHLTFMFHRCLTCPELKAQICQDRSLHLGEDFKENKTFFKKFKIIHRNDFRYSSNQNINFYSSTVHFMLLIRVQNAGATV